MDKELLSVGLDVGTTTTQMILSKLLAQNQAAAFAVPKMEITRRWVIYRSPVRFTPLDRELVDGTALREWVEQQYALAGITRGDVDTGAVIITGETSRKENARRVLAQLSGLAGDFVVATAGPDLESVLAARGSGAVDRSAGKRILHMDIGGGTSNLCLIEDGKILTTGCLNVGGRLVKLNPQGEVTDCSPVLEGLCDLKVGECPPIEKLEAVARMLASALEMAAGLCPPTELLTRLTTGEAAYPWTPPQDVTVSFSGGVADCIGQDVPPLAYGDLGPLLGKAIGASRLCRGDYFLGEETIRATVIGAGCHSTDLSGSTVYYQNIRFPLKNLPVIAMDDPVDPLAIRSALAMQDTDGILAIPGYPAPAYERVRQLAEILAEGFGGRPVLVCLQADMAKALGHCLRRRLGEGQPCLCIDGLHLQRGDYLDVGAPVGPALPVVMKTLVLKGGNP